MELHEQSCPHHREGQYPDSSQELYLCIIREWYFLFIILGRSTPLAKGLPAFRAGQLSRVKFTRLMQAEEPRPDTAATGYSLGSRRVWSLSQYTHD